MVGHRAGKQASRHATVRVLQLLAAHVTLQLAVLQPAPAHAVPRSDARTAAAAADSAAVGSSGDGATPGVLIN